MRRYLLLSPKEHGPYGTNIKGLRLKPILCIVRGNGTCLEEQTSGLVKLTIAKFTTATLTPVRLSSHSFAFVGHWRVGTIGSNHLQGVRFSVECKFLSKLALHSPFKMMTFKTCPVLIYFVDSLYAL